MIIYIAQSMQEYIRNFKLSCSRIVRQGYNSLFPSRGKFDFVDETSKYLQSPVLYKALSNIVYGHIIPELQKIDDIRLSIWISNYGLDAAESTIPLKFGPMQKDGKGAGYIKPRLHASASHLCCDWGLVLREIRFLEKAGEKYDIVIVQQLAACIARNMQLVRECIDFAIHLNLDTGTECNVENIRNCIIEGIIRFLSLSSDAKEWTNQFNVRFDFTQFRITVNDNLI